MKVQQCALFSETRSGTCPQNAYTYYMAATLLVTALYLILSHALPLAGLHFPYENEAYRLLQLVSGVLLILHIRATRQRQLGLVLAGAFFVLVALFALTELGGSGPLLVAYILAAVAGVLLIGGYKKYTGLRMAYLFFGLYLLVLAAVHFLHPKIQGLPYLVAGLAILTGVLIIVRR